MEKGVRAVKTKRPLWGTQSNHTHTHSHKHTPEHRQTQSGTHRLLLRYVYAKRALSS